MAPALRFKPKDRQTRLIFTDGPGGAMPEHQGKVFALIGPFDCFTDKLDLQYALEMLIRGYNLEEPEGDGPAVNAPPAQPSG